MNFATLTCPWFLVSFLERNAAHDVLVSVFFYRHASYCLFSFCCGIYGELHFHEIVVHCNSGPSRPHLRSFNLVSLKGTCVASCSSLSFCVGLFQSGVANPSSPSTSSPPSTDISSSPSSTPFNSVFSASVKFVPCALWREGEGITEGEGMDQLRATSSTDGQSRLDIFGFLV